MCHQPHQPLAWHHCEEKPHQLVYLILSMKEVQYLQGEEHVLQALGELAAIPPYSVVN